MSLSAADNQTKPPLRDRIIPWYFVMAFLVVFIVNAVFIYLATSTHRGVVTENAYKKGMDYNHIVSETKKHKSHTK